MVDEAKTMRVKGEATLGQESETERGWAYGVAIRWSNGTTTEHVLSLSWADHESIAGGYVRPSVLASAALGVMLATNLGFIAEDTMPGRVDVSTLRRLIAGFDDAVRSRLT